jgi:hypothetical protein
MKTEKSKVLEERLTSVKRDEGIEQHMAHVEHDVEHAREEEARTNK